MWSCSGVGIEPLVEPGGCAARAPAVSVELPRDSVKRATTSRWLLRAFAMYPTAVELRHHTWNETPHETEALLAEHGAAWVMGDSPVSRDETHGQTADLMYMRMHGRNIATWWQHEHAEDA